MVPEITTTGEIGRIVAIEVSDTGGGPWTKWQTVVIGEQGTTEVDLGEGPGKRLYSVRWQIKIYSGLYVSANASISLFCVIRHQTKNTD
jgi:hypothetical protein